MALTADTLARTLHLAAEEAQTLRSFLDALDGWDGKDLDTGTNAFRTLDAMSTSMRSVSESMTFAQGLDIASEMGVMNAVGHCGQLLSLLCHSWFNVLDGHDVVTSVLMRHMLKATVRAADGHMELSESVSMLLDECAAELDSLGDTLPAIDELSFIYASHCQYALVEATNRSTGRIDPGAAVLTLFVSCLDATIRLDVSLLQSFAQMLADLAASHQPRGPRHRAPEQNRAYTVDMLISASKDEAQQVSQRMKRLGACHSFSGREDFFGVGQWRFHVDTAAPMAVFPRGNTVRAFTVADARPHEMLGVDGLADSFIHRGVQILERPSLTRVERAHVVVLSNCPGLVESFAQSGATVLLHPRGSDMHSLIALAHASTTGTTLFIPTDEDTAHLAQQVCERVPPPLRVIVADSHDEMTAQAMARATATTFVPQPGGYEAADALVDVLVQAMDHINATTRSIALPDTDIDTLTQAVDDLEQFGAKTWRLLVGNHADPHTGAVIHHLLHRNHGFEIVGIPVSTPDCDVIDGQYSGPSVLQGIQ